MLGPGPRGSGFRVWGLMFSPHVLGRSCSTHKGFPKIRVPCWGPYSKGYSICGSILGLGKLPCGIFVPGRA